MKMKMSNKIKELAGQSLDKVVPYTWTNLTYDELWALQEYFGKLIVKECVKLQYKNVVVGGVSDYNRGRRELAEEILKHFGVE